MNSQENYWQVCVNNTEKHYPLWVRMGKQRCLLRNTTGKSMQLHDRVCRQEVVVQILALDRREGKETCWDMRGEMRDMRKVGTNITSEWSNMSFFSIIISCIFLHALIFLMKRYKEVNRSIVGKHIEMLYLIIIIYIKWCCYKLKSYCFLLFLMYSLISKWLIQFLY